MHVLQDAMRNPKRLRPAAATASPPLFSVSCVSISDDLLEFGILPRLPAKSLIRFKCVSRKWYGIISNPHPKFVHLQSKHAASCLVFLRHGTLKAACISRDSTSIGIPTFDCPMKRFLRPPKIEASCNGLLCLIDVHAFCKFDLPEKNIVIGNPSLNNWKLLPDNPLNGVTGSKLLVYGLAVEVGESFVRYQLVILVYKLFHVDGKHQLLVFSSVTQQWSTTNIKLPYASSLIFVDKSALYVNGYMYWKIKRSNNVLCLNMENKNIHIHPLPPGANDPEHGNIGDYRGKLSYALIMGREIQIWSLNHQIWLKMLSISIDTERPNFHKMQLRRSRPSYKHSKDVSMMMFEAGDCLSFSMDKVMYSYDISQGVFHFHGEVNIRDRLYLLPYKNTLVSLAGEEENESEEQDQRNRR